MMNPLKGTELESKLTTIPDWGVFDGGTKLKRDFAFANFREALAFVNKVGELAEAANHHPNIYMHDYKKVEIELSTHDIGGLSEKDFNLASKIDGL